MSATKHFSERLDRNSFIYNVIGLGHPIREVIWDKGHKNGPEIHTVTDTGVIIIRNQITKKLVTTLIARPKQIARYFGYINDPPPKYLMELAENHQKLGYNLI